MPGLSAVVFIPDDTAKTGYSRPMMLQNIMGTPLLSWLASSLIAGGVGRFFMVCHERFRRDVRACIPDDVGFFCPHRRLCPTSSMSSCPRRMRARRMSSSSPARPSSALCQRRRGV